MPYDTKEEILALGVMDPELKAVRLSLSLSLPDPY